MKIGNKVIVLAKSQKGRNRIAEHGNKWKIRKIWGSKILLESKLNNGLRWVHGNTDPDFEIIFDWRF